MRIPAAAFFILIASLQAGAQTESETDTAGNVFSLNISSMSFIRNNEYYNQVKASEMVIVSELPAPVDKSVWIEGYTLSGFWFQPEVAWDPSEKIRVSAGAHLLKYSGLDRFSRALPVFSVSLDITRNSILTLGTLSGAQSHRMPDPVFNFERRYYLEAEEGIQLRTITGKVFNDAWIDWENFIFRGDTTREVFTLGESFHYTTGPFAGNLRAGFPVSLQLKHYGGQISNYYGHVTSFLNMSFGTSLSVGNGDGHFGETSVELDYLINKVLPSRKTYTINSGHAFWLRAEQDYRWLRLGVSYWNARNFYAPNGNGIYASVYDFGSDYRISHRELYTVSASLDVAPAEWMELYFGFEGFYDVPSKRFDHAMTLHFRIDRLISLKGRR